jgi:hypothetical protein
MKNTMRIININELGIRSVNNNQKNLTEIDSQLNNNMMNINQMDNQFNDNSMMNMNQTDNQFNNNNMNNMNQVDNQFNNNNLMNMNQGDNQFNNNMINMNQDNQFNNNSMMTMNNQFNNNSMMNMNQGDNPFNSNSMINMNQDDNPFNNNNIMNINQINDQYNNNNQNIGGRKSVSSKSQANFGEFNLDNINRGLRRQRTQSNLFENKITLFDEEIDAYPYINEEKKLIIFERNDKKQVRVKVPLSLRNDELYSTAIKYQINEDLCYH